MRIFVSDFDGTITERDVAQLILDKYAGPQWLEIEEEHRARKISIREALSRQFALVKATREELIAFVDKVASLDPYFSKFLSYLGEKGQRIEIVSEGLDFYIKHLMSKWHLKIPYKSNRTSFRDRLMMIGYPHADSRCTLCGTCKMGRVIQLRAQGYEVVYLGNGYSDICPALEADRVFAKGTLASLCEDEGREYIPFNDFGDVLKEVSTW